MKKLLFIIPIIVIFIAVFTGYSTVSAQGLSDSQDTERNQAVIDQRKDWNRQERELEDARSDLKSMNVPETVPQDIAEYCESAGQHFGISPEMLMAIAWKESSFNPKAENGSCKGLMQINVKVHEDKLAIYGGDWSDTRTSIYTAAMVISEIMSDDNADLGAIMSLYHGEGTPDAYSDYTKEVGRISMDYERIDGKYTY